MRRRTGGALGLGESLVGERIVLERVVEVRSAASGLRLGRLRAG